MKQALHVALIDVTPEVSGALYHLEKTEVKSKDHLLGDFVELESVLYFDGLPIRFLKQDQILYLRDTVFEMGGLVENAYLTELDGEQGAYSREYINRAIALRKRRLRELIERNESACRGVAAATLKYLRKNETTNECKLIITEFERLKKEARFFTRPGKPDFLQSQVQMLRAAIDRNHMESANILKPVINKIKHAEQKIEKAAAMILARDYSDIEPVREEIPPLPEKKPDVVRILSSELVMKIYCAEQEAAEISDLEKMTDSAIREDPEQDVKSEKTEEVSEFTNEKDFDKLTKSGKIIKGVKSQSIDKGEQKNAKSNSKGLG